MGEKPNISDETADVDSVQLDKFIEDMGKLSSIYLKPAEAVSIRKRGFVIEKHVDDEEEVNEYDSSGQKVGNLGDLLGLQENENRLAKVPLQVVLNKENPGVAGNSGLQIEMAFRKKYETSAKNESKNSQRNSWLHVFS